MLSNLSRPAVGEERKRDGWMESERTLVPESYWICRLLFQSRTNTPISNKQCMATPVHQPGLQFVSLSVIIAGEIVQLSSTSEVLF
jgi:hypothetical protein